MIFIDSSKCTGCGQCTRVCPFTVLRLNQEGKAENTGKKCIACMHCAAICPADAITYDSRPAVAEKTQPLPEDCSTTVKQLIYQRRSYRRFLKKKVPGDILRAALDAAENAPSAKNEHPVRWIILESEEIRKCIMDWILEYCKENQVSVELISEYANGNNPVMGENAVIIIGICRRNSINPAQDTAIALTTAELLLQAEGIGTCWGGYLTRFLNLIPECRVVLEIPEGYEVYGTLLAGYPDRQNYRYLPARKKAEIKII